MCYVRGRDVARKVIQVVESEHPDGIIGPLMLTSLRPIGQILHTRCGKLARCRTLGLPVEANDATNNSDPMMGFQWFSKQEKGVYIVQLQGSSSGLHAVVVDAGSGVIVDGDQQRMLKLSAVALGCARGPR